MTRPYAVLSQAVDKMGRTAKRSADIHVKNAMSKPRVATTIRRVAALLGSASDLREYIPQPSLLP